MSLISFKLPCSCENNIFIHYIKFAIIISPAIPFQNVLSVQRKLFQEIITQTHNLNEVTYFFLGTTLTIFFAVLELTLTYLYLLFGCNTSSLLVEGFELDYKKTIRFTSSLNKIKPNTAIEAFTSFFIIEIFWFKFISKKFWLIYNLIFFMWNYNLKYFVCT